MFLKGICYSAFPIGYNPSTANDSCIFYGSDIASYNLKAIWGPSFSPFSGPDLNKIFLGRNDLKDIKRLGVNLIRLYDWDPRNNHLDFLDYCYSLGIFVLVPVSNYNLGVFGEAPDMDTSIKSLINSFTVRNQSNYHPAIYGITIGNEIDLQPKNIQEYLVNYTKRWVEIENQFFPSFKKLKIGHPTSFSIQKKKFPCFNFWDIVLPSLETYSELKDRLILCPQTYNNASYLYDTIGGAYRGWVDITYDKYKLPILFTEIGCSRMDRSDYMDVTAKQLERSMIYSDYNTEKLIGICYFQYCDKVWAPKTSEGSFGVVRNTSTITEIIRFGAKDFTHTNGNNCDNQRLNISTVEKNPTYNVMKLIYNSKS